MSDNFTKSIEKVKEEYLKSLGARVNKKSLGRVDIILGFDVLPEGPHSLIQVNTNAPQEFSIQRPELVSNWEK